jgi:outer membrane protein TolC
MKKIILAVILFMVSNCHAQNILTRDEFIDIVKKFHPVAKQALLDVGIAEAYLTATRGHFDPVLNFQNGRKEFDGTNYYRQQQGELKIPTWYGLDLHAGIESMEGERVNPEETKGRIYYTGISMPLIQNVIMDKRRAAVQQAKILRDQSEVARKTALNNLVAEAVLSYWDWWEQFRQLKITQASVQNARTRLEMVKTMYRMGDRPAIDTLEATTQVQVFEQQESEAAMLLLKSKLQLSLYLWEDGGVAYELPDDVIPEAALPSRLPELDSLLREAATQPLLLQYDYDLSVLGIERKLKFQTLLPEVTAKYHALTKNASKTFNHGLFDNDFRFGLTLSMPLRLSEGRGQYKAAKLKIEKTRLERSMKQVSIQNSVKQYYVEWQQTLLQYQQQQKLLSNYMALQRGEETRFSNGESSLFLINAREARTLEGQRKELALMAKMKKAEVSLFWAAGSFIN